MLVFFALGDAKVPKANGFASQWNIGLRIKQIFPFLLLIYVSLGIVYLKVGGIEH